jgi:hypothetical protein
VIDNYVVAFVTQTRQDADSSSFRHHTFPSVPKVKMKNSRIQNCRFACQSIAICALLSFLCSCATRTDIQLAAPAKATFNSDAGWDDIEVKLRMDNGNEITPVLVDTGGNHTVFDKSLAPLLGKRVGSGVWYEPFLGGLVRVDVYNAPKLYLGDVPLALGRHVYVYDLQKAQRGLKGILAVDCLRHYCVQFDFSRNEMDFLDPGVPANSDFGKPMPFMIIDNLVIARGDCFGTGNIFFCPDTGCLFDAVLKPKLMRRLAKKQKPSWSDSFSGVSKKPRMIEGFSNGAFCGESYTDLTVAQWYGSWPDGELVGLPFFERNLVTFDFPKRMMYIKKQSSGPRNRPLLAHYKQEEAATYLVQLFKNGNLPGWATNDSGEWKTLDVPKCITNYPVLVTVSAHKQPVPGWVDVTAKLASTGASGARSISAADALAKYDPAPGCRKTLRITLRDGKREQTIEIPEGNTLTLSPQADVLEARYGVLSGPAVSSSPHDTSLYHFTVGQNVPDGPWKLTKAWQSDEKGRLIKDYEIAIED